MTPREIGARDERAAAGAWASRRARGDLARLMEAFPDGWQENAMDDEVSVQDHGRHAAVPDGAARTWNGCRRVSVPQLTGALRSAAVSGKDLDDVLRRIGLNLAGLALDRG